MSEANKAAPAVKTGFVMATASNADVKKHVEGVVGNCKKAVSEVHLTFIGLCERYTGKDSQSGDMLQHFFNQFDDSLRTARNRFIKSLRECSDNQISIVYDDEKSSFIVGSKKDEKGKSTLDVKKFSENVALVKYGKDLPGATKEPKVVKFNAGKAEKKVADTLKEYAVKLSQSEHLKPEQLEIKLTALIKMIMVDVKPVIDAEPVKPELKNVKQAVKDVVSTDPALAK